MAFASRGSAARTSRKRSTFPATVRLQTSYTRARDVADEVVEARMLLGVHFRAADEDGSKIGRRTARRIRSRLFKRDSDRD